MLEEGASPGANGPEGRGLVSSLWPVPVDLFSGLAPPQCLIWLPSICLLSLASLPSIPLTMPSSGGCTQDSPALQSPAHPSPVSGKAGAQSRAIGWGCLGKELLGFAPLPPSLHTCLRPQPAPQGPHLARVLSFPGCKLPPAAPWHLLRFRLHEPFSLGGSGKNGGPAYSLLLSISGRREKPLAMFSVILLFRSWVSWVFSRWLSRNQF